MANKEIKYQLGIAGTITKNFISSPLSIILFFVMLGAGILGLFATPRQEDPQISVPLIDIFIEYPGASSKEVSDIIVRPLERRMSNLLGVKHVYSVSDRGNSIITVEFDVGEKMSEAIIKVRNKILSNIALIPLGAKIPIVKTKEIDDVPIVNITLWSEKVDDGQLRSLALELLQQLEHVKNTNNGFIVGGRQEIFHVDIYPSRLSSYGISLQQITDVIRSANTQGKSGFIDIDGYEMQIYSGGFFAKASDIENLVVSVTDNKAIYIRDVAEVYYAPEETRQMVNYYTGVASEEKTKNGKKRIVNGAQAVTVAVAKKFGSNGIEVANDILARVETLKGSLIPYYVNVSVTRNYGKSAKDKVDELIVKLFIATGAVALLIWFALGWRPAIVVTLVIPVVLLMTIFSAWLMGLTIDRVSLFALIFSIGILVDDAIVVVENIYRRWLIDKKITIATAIDAVREVGNPTILATFTVIAALMPMAAVRGMMGPYMEPIPLLGSVAMIFSLFAAFIFTPYFVMKLATPIEILKKMGEKEEKEAQLLHRFYHYTINQLFSNLRYGWIFLASMIFAFFLAVSMFYTTSVVVKMLPLDNKNLFSVVLDMPDGSSLANTASTLAKMAYILRDIPEVVALQTYTGTSQPFDFNGLVRHYYLRKESSHGEIQVQILDKKKRNRSSHEIALEARALIKKIALEADAHIALVEMPPGPPVLRPVVAEVYGPDHTSRQKLAHDLTKLFTKSGTMADVDNYMRDKYPVWHFEVDTEKAIRLGVSVQTIKETLDMAMSGFKVTTVRLKNALEPTDVRLQIPLAKRSQLNYLKQLPVPAKNGVLVSITELGEFRLKKQDDLLFHKNLVPVEYVVGEPISRLSAPIYAMSGVDELLKEYKISHGEVLQGNYLPQSNTSGDLSFDWAGEWTITYETFRDMGLAFAVALVVIYMLVVWQFGNFLTPAIIMAPIPLTLLGIVPGHWLLDAEFTATSMIGWIALAGIIVRNSILLVDFTVQEYAKGVDFFDAVVNSCSARTRPILITAFALVGGSMVILFDPIFQGMAISLLFGVLISTVLTLLVIPLGMLSAGKEACHRVGIYLKLLPDAPDADDKYNISKPKKAKPVMKSTQETKAWIEKFTNKTEHDAKSSHTSKKENMDK